MIRSILFDMVGVLIFQKTAFAAKTADEINAFNIEKLYNHIDDQKWLDDVKQKLQLTDDQIEKALSKIPEKFEAYTDLWANLPDLKLKYIIAVINNGNSLAMKYWNDRFDFSIFDLFINSGIEKIRKPDPAIYLLACEKLDVKPEECLFMDDTLENVVAAEKLGMKTL